MNQKELAEAAFISRSYLNEIEAGLKKPRLRVALSIAKALGCDLDELIS
jgi:transcriptional regulator with XRE-family HTH domain